MSFDTNFQNYHLGMSGHQNNHSRDSGARAAFAAALKKEANMDPTLGLGENGALEHKVIRSNEITDLITLLANVLHDKTRSFQSSVDIILGKICAKSNGMHPARMNVIMEILMRTIAYIRDARREGMGKGSRDPAYYIFLKTVELFPAWRAKLKDFLHPFFRKYGSLGDANRLWKYAGTVLSGNLRRDVQRWIRDFLAKMTEVLRLQMENGRIPLSLIAKWLPREGKMYHHLAKQVAIEWARRYGHPPNKAFKLYRQVCSKGNKLINTVETLMCGRKFGQIDFNKVPGRCLAMHTLAWQNKNKDGSARSHRRGRVLCANHYKTWIDSLSDSNSKGAKGTSMFITEICRRMMAGPSLSDRKLLNAMFDDQKKELMRFAQGNSMDLGEFLSHFVVLADFSGSMAGDPMNLACALAIFVTSMAKGPFKDRFISFETNPQFVDLSCAHDTTAKARVCSTSPWGGSTNFYSAHKLILKCIETVFIDAMSDGMSKKDLEKLVLSTLPSVFLVVSDMQFDAAGGCTWDTMHQALVKPYADEGMRLIGKPLQLPTMLYWNARNTGGAPVVAKTRGALMVSGYSTSLIKNFMALGLDGLMNCTPWGALEKTLRNPWYDDATNGRMPLETVGNEPPKDFEEAKTNGSPEVFDDSKDVPWDVMLGGGR